MRKTFELQRMIKILSALDSPLTITTLTYRVEVNYQQLKPTVENALKLGFIEMVKQTPGKIRPIKYYRITRLGSEWLKQIKALTMMVD